MTSASRKVLSSFGRASQTYDKYAVMQAVASNSLAQMLPNKLHNVCELGCGTGIMTYHIIDKYPNNLIISDISEEMLYVAREKFPIAQPVIMQAQNLPIKFINTIISNMMLQWVDGLARTINQLSKCCNELYFSLPLESSMHEWDNFCQANQIQNCRQPLPKLNSILNYIPKTHAVSYTISNFCLYYSSWLTFWQSQKRLGTNKSLTRAHSLYKTRNKLATGPIKVTYDICCIAMRKK